MYCRMCGKEIIEGSLSCGQCGTLIVDDTTSYVIRNYCTKCGSQIVNVDGLCLNCFKNNQTIKNEDKNFTIKQKETPITNSSNQSKEDSLIKPNETTIENNLKQERIIPINNTILNYDEKPKNKYDYLKRTKYLKHKNQKPFFERISDFFADNENKYPFFTFRIIVVGIILFFIFALVVSSCVKTISDPVDSDINNYYQDYLGNNFENAYPLYLNNDQTSFLIEDNSTKFFKYTPLQSTYYEISLSSSDISDLSIALYRTATGNQIELAYSTTSNSLRSYLNANVTYYFAITNDSSSNLRFKAMFQIK